jgi:hypothetical protein
MEPELCSIPGIVPSSPVTGGDSMKMTPSKHQTPHSLRHMSCLHSSMHSTGIWIIPFRAHDHVLIWFHVTQLPLQGHPASFGAQKAPEYRTHLTEHTPQVRGCPNGPIWWTRPWEYVWRQWSVNGMGRRWIPTSQWYPVSRAHVNVKHLISPFLLIFLQFTFPNYTHLCALSQCGTGVQWHVSHCQCCPLLIRYFTTSVIL